MSHDLDGMFHCRKVQEILAAAQQAEDEVHQVQDITRGITRQSFHMFAIPAGTPAVDTPALPVVRAYPSQTEHTLAKYQGNQTPPPGTLAKYQGNQTPLPGNGTPYGRHTPKCFGCGGPHGFQDKDDEITCPYGHDPKVKEAAKREYKAFCKHLNDRYKARMVHFRGRCSGDGRGAGSPVNYLKMSAEDQRRIHEQVLAAKASTNNPLVFMLTVQSIRGQVLAATNTPACRILPIKIHMAFLHIVMQLGLTLGGSDCPSIWAIIDTAAALTTGNLHFFAKIAKMFPHTVAAVYAPQDYSPITLSKIVKQNGKSITTKLTVAFKFKLPYLTKEGNTTTFMVAVGLNVMVNTILGLPFIKQTKMIVDMVDQVAELRALDALPFPIDFRRVQCHVPTINETKVHVNVAQYADIIQEIDNIEKLYPFDLAVQHTATPPSSILPKKHRPNVRVTFHPSVAPALEDYPSSIGYTNEPFNVVMPISNDGLEIDHCKA
jgi:hypothetical protein